MQNQFYITPYYINNSVRQFSLIHKVKSTCKLIADKVLGQDNAEDRIDWALEMTEAGIESVHLFILAGLSPKLNRFEFDEIVNKTVKELSLDKSTNEETLNGYVYYLTSEAHDGKLPTTVISYAAFVETKTMMKSFSLSIYWPMLGRNWKN